MSQELAGSNHAARSIVQRPTTVFFGVQPQCPGWSRRQVATMAAPLTPGVPVWSAAPSGTALCRRAPLNHDLLTQPGRKAYEATVCKTRWCHITRQYGF
jgi:hypothetical protein